MTHVDYPHEPGRLYDCPACESQCFCTGEPGHAPCVCCGEEESGCGTCGSDSDECADGCLYEHLED